MPWFFSSRPPATPTPVQEPTALVHCFQQWMRLKGRAVPADRLRQQLATLPGGQTLNLEGVRRVATHLDESVRFVVLTAPQQAALPLLAQHPEAGWLVVTGRTLEGLWRCVDAQGHRHELVMDQCRCLHTIEDPSLIQTEVRSARGLMFSQIRSSWPLFLEAAGLSLVLASIGIAISFYTMQVYDRVIPSQGHQTLWVLTAGVALAILLEWLLKLARTGLLEPRLKQLDVGISKALMSRLQAIRQDQRPGSIGTLASQIQSFESIRSILSTSTLFLLFDLPMATLFAGVIAVVGGPWLALPALLLFMLNLLGGLLRARRIARLSASNVSGANAKTGLLVESIEGAEAIKGMGAGWRFDNRWAGLSESNAVQSLALKHETDAAGYLAAGMQQVSYVALICIGAVLAIDGHITQGAIVACSILSGRVLSPLASIPGLLVQLGNAAASMKALDAIYALETDNHDVARPLVPEQPEGDIAFDQVEFAYPGQKQPLKIGNLKIRSGEKVAILGTIGAGKSTLLSLACGMSKPTQGTVYLGGVDQQQLHAGWRSEHMGYCPQQSWLFSGTLRDNLAFGLTDVSDEQIIQAAQKTGLWPIVSQHPMGLDRKLTEGGRGLSGGQRQLVVLTRLLLAQRRFWLLDEPTANMDDGLEQSAVGLLKAELKPETTLLLVTHRLPLLALVSRVVVLTPNGILMDGPRDEVLARLQQRPTAPAASVPATAKAVPTAAAAGNTGRPTVPAKSPPPVPTVTLNPCRSPNVVQRPLPAPAAPPSPSAQPSAVA
ncbi:ATP-binding cassette domain-containing protein [Roseateles sp. SL47]|uniref:ATP-binding cassette domain-containing protein n=1 Tax=Roseateles sp. SL47 TaxID=2995138 RepID=UPI002270E71D|nr:ATP-binding cassette domain-containing protein [Roseateles sp. SL47]WAC71787.1 ATP-binding cassette domain-containing protein [Roseateles sp. SL47]